MVGGTAEDLERARPALEPLAKTIVHVGPLGSGAAMKLAVNTVIFGLNEALAEGLVLAEAAGIDRELAYGSSPIVRSARRMSGTSGRRSSRPTRRPSRSPSTSRQRTSG